MKKKDYMFRPINVPFKNKWLRKMASDFYKHDLMKMTDYNNEAIFKRIVSDMQLHDSI